jgi:hypothetical protein
MARQRGIVVPISASDNTDRAFAEVNARVAELQARLRVAEAGAGSFGRTLGDGMGHAVPEIAAASGAIREFEGNLPIRAVERFLSTTLGLGPALAAAFPVVGAIALAGVLKEGVDKLVETRDKALAAGEALRVAFEQAVIAERTHADELAVTNERLQQTLDKLQNKPANGLALGLAEDRAEADKLYESLTKDVEAADKLAEQSKVGFAEKLFAGAADSTEVVDQIKNTSKALTQVKRDYDEAYQAASDGGATKQNLADIREAEMSRLEGVYAKAEGTLRPLLAKLRKEQEDFNSPFSTGRDHTKEITAVTGALELYAAQQRSIGEQYRNADLAPRVANAKAAAANRPDDGSAQREAQATFDEAIRKAAEQAAQARIASAKLAADLEIASLDEKHKRELISDQDFYAQRAAIQVAALEAEADAVSSKQGAVDDNIRKAIIRRGQDLSDPTAVTKDDAKIVDLQTQLNELESQRLKINQDIAKIKTQPATEDYEATKKAADETLKLQAQLESIRGGSTSARDAEIRKQFDDRRRAAGPGGAGAANALEGIADAQAGDSDAQRAYQDASGGISVARQRLAYGQATGQVTAAQAQREKIALDREEAEALQPLIEAQQKLADLGVAGAAEKVDALKEKMYELANPVNEIAESVRTNLGGALETLFDNMDKGQKALEQFGKSLEKLVLDQTYKQFIQPGVQSGLGAIFPNNAGRGATPGFSVGSALGGLIPGLGKIAPGIGLKGGSGDITVQIINQGSPLASGGASQQTAGGQQDDFPERVISVILKDAESNGSAIQAILGAVANG